jgi:hypothetical protein
LTSWQRPLTAPYHGSGLRRFRLGSALAVALVAGALGASAPVATAHPNASQLSAATAPTSVVSQAGIAKRRACAGLKGTKLRRCRAIAKCKKLGGKKRRKCLARAHKIGAKTQPQAPSVQPPKAPPPTVQPPPTIQPPKANQAPLWPNPFRHQTTTIFQYDPTTGFLIGATTTIDVLTPPVDPDGDPLTYTWAASNGIIVGNGVSATWTRVVSFGRPSPGDVTVTASDGRGGSSPFTIRFL